MVIEYISFTPPGRPYPSPLASSSNMCSFNSWPNMCWSGVPLIPAWEAPMLTFSTCQRSTVQFRGDRGLLPHHLPCPCPYVPALGVQVDDVELLVLHIMGTLKHLESKARQRVQFSHASGNEARSKGPHGLVPWDCWLQEVSRAVSPFVFEKSGKFAYRLGAESHRLGFGPAWASMKRNPLPT